MVSNSKMYKILKKYKENNLTTNVGSTLQRSIPKEHLSIIREIWTQEDNKKKNFNQIRDLIKEVHKLSYSNAFYRNLSKKDDILHAEGIGKRT